jgi:uncharacterized membrane protein (UPF0127 family)
MESRSIGAENKITWVVVILAVFGLVYVGYNALFGDVKNSTPVSVGAKTFYAKLARTDLEREKGLSGTDKLAENEAMLFVFDRESTWKIWMKDMKYPIDIVWINDEKKVVHAVRSARPESYPDRYFMPSQDALYVLELPDGSVNKYGISTGKKVNFDIQEGI